MKRKFWIGALVGLAAVLSVAGWGLDIHTEGRPFRLDKVNELVPAITTYREAVALIGPTVEYKRGSDVLLNNGSVLRSDRDVRYGVWNYRQEVQFFGLYLYIHQETLSVVFRNDVADPDLHPLVQTGWFNILDGNKMHVYRDGLETDI